MRLSVVSPAYNESGNIEPLYERLTAACEACSNDQEFIFVDDGSADATMDELRAIADRDPRVKVVSFSRNFGHEAATTAGMNTATGDAVVLIDADLQDPPELIPEMVERWRNGADVVYAVRRTRDGESLLKRATSAMFYNVIDRLSDTRIPRHTGDFRLMDRRACEAVSNLPENPRFIRALCAWVGFRQESITYDRDARHAGETKYNYRKLFVLAFDSICSFSLAPLRAIMWLGMGAIALSMLFAGAIIVERLFLEPPERGYAFLACMMLFIGGVQILMIGMIAYYIGLIFRNVQRRPHYLVGETLNLPDERSNARAMRAATVMTRPVEVSAPERTAEPDPGGAPGDALASEPPR